MCFYILNSKIYYYTKETFKILRIATIAFLMILAVILIKYEFKYQVSMNQDIIGYIDSETEIEELVDKAIVMEKINYQIAFVDWKIAPTLQLKLVDRTIQNDEEKIKEKIASELTIEYTNFAICINGESKTIVSSKEEAEIIVEELKKDYADKYTNSIGIIQVYSEDAEAITAVEKENAKATMDKILKANKQKDRQTKQVKKTTVAKTKKTSSSTSKTKTSVKVASVNGIHLSERPVTGTVTSRFGRRSSPGGIGSTNHKGLDIGAAAGTPIYAVAAGTVTFAGTKGSLGKLVIINHGNGVQTYYGHCSNINVTNGQKVEAGSQIAAVGKSGAATGYHLHFEIHVNGTAVNPQKYIY